MENSTERKRPLRRWSAGELEDLRRRYGRVSLAKLSGRYGRSPSAVAVKAHSLGLKGRPRRSFTEDEVALIRAEYADTLTTETAGKLHAPAGQVMQAANRMGLRKSEAYMKAMRERRSVKTSATWARKRKEREARNKGFKEESVRGGVMDYKKLT